MIYVADDDPILRRGLDVALKGRGYAVRTAPDGPALLSMVEMECPDLIVLDVMMPGMSGLEVFRHLRRDGRWRDLPVMIVTAVPDAEVHAEARDGGGAEVLPKPFRLRDLLARIEARVAGRGARAGRPRREGAVGGRSGGEAAPEVH